MNRQQMLLTCLGEEGSEVAQQCPKAIRFGMDEVKPGLSVEETNEARLVAEIVDLIAVAQMLNIMPDIDDSWTQTCIRIKKEKVEKYLAYSAKCGVYEPLLVKEQA